MLDSPSARERAVVDGADFSVAVHPHRSHVVVAPSGEMDLATADQVDRELVELRRAGFQDIVLDLRAITFIDSTGLRLLLTHARSAREDGYRFRLVGGPPAVARLFEITGTTQAFEFVERPPS